MHKVKIVTKSVSDKRGYPSLSFTEFSFLNKWNAKAFVENVLEAREVLKLEITLDQSTEED